MGQKGYPLREGSQFFTILLVGGSVAAQLAHGSNEIKDEVHWLEDELNRRFISPNKKPFRVLSGAASGWRMPTQIVSATLYGPNVDAVVSLDGYNEADSAHAKSSIHKPDSWTWSMVQNAENGKSLKLALKFLKTYRLFVKSTPVLRDSKALFFAYEGASKVLLSNEDLRQSQAPAAKFQFSYPAEFTESQINAANIEQWKSDLLALYGITQALGLRYLHFIQPIPKLYKTLTSEELNAGHWIDGEFYKKMIVAPAVSLKKNGYPTEPLTGIYLHVKDRVYFDPIHSSMAAKSLGYTLISQKMANHMAKYWKLKLKPK